MHLVIFKVYFKSMIGISAQNCFFPPFLLPSLHPSSFLRSFPPPSLLFFSTPATSCCGELEHWRWGSRTRERVSFMVSHVDRGLCESQAGGTLTALAVEFSGAPPGLDFRRSPLQEGDPDHWYRKLTFIKKLSWLSHKV